MKQAGCVTNIVDGRLHVTHIMKNAFLVDGTGINGRERAENYKNLSTDDDELD